ncbi:TniQ family protein [Colwellia sp. MB02u-10]|jgi:hypothetical protein|uniref:TnsD family Tn7-like transposition protein n=1 Tax=Colwellia sp. MB02u-10 TaxID=2759828 RepID=UPI0015F70AD9|nr:TnsD family Tn7-like transposition protein [Colwellia sp. MB02u-10]MBA6339606.1 TniQ family protein [Colwellia sp. MB02u-10]
MWLNEMIYPDESLYSISSRLVLIQPSPTFASAYEYLWGNRNVQLDAVFPSNLPQLSQLTNKPVYYLIEHHSMVNYYRAFSEPDKFSNALSRLIKGDAKHMSAMFSIVANCLAESKTLKYCPVCSAGDASEFGIAYWHRSHQLPAVEICIKHHVKLIDVPRSRKVPILPPQSGYGLADEDINADEHWWCKISTDLLFNKPAIYIEQNKFIKCLMVRLYYKGFITSSFHIRQHEWGFAIQRYWEGIKEQPLIHQAINSVSGANYFPQYVSYRKTGHFHPVKYLLIIGHLFEGFEDFVDSYNSCEEELIFILSRRYCKRLPRNEIHTNESQVVEKLNEGNSLRAVAKIFHRSVLFIKKTAEIHGVSINRREQVLFAKERHQVMLRLSAYESTEKIAKAFGVSQTAIEHILSSAPDVVLKRKEQRFIIKRDIERNLLIKFLVNNPNCLRNTVRKTITSTYLWLFKNDKKWFYLNLPDAVPRSERRNNRIGKMPKIDLDE